MTPAATRWALGAVIRAAAGRAYTGPKWRATMAAFVAGGEDDARPSRTDTMAAAACIAIGQAMRARILEAGFKP